LIRRQGTGPAVPGRTLARRDAGGDKLMPAVCLYFQVHQPRRLRRYPVFSIGREHDYEDEDGNKKILDKVTEKCYLPANDLLLRLVRRHGGRFRLAFSLTGVLLDQLAGRHPEVIAGWQELAATGCVEFLNETYYHSLAFLYSGEEFRGQVERHRRRVHGLFGQEGETFRGTELIYNDDLAAAAAEMGYRVILAEGTATFLGAHDPNRVYRVAGRPGIKVLPRNYRLSDDISFRFSSRGWDGYPLTAAKYAAWLHRLGGPDTVINLFMDYETFGEHQWRETGIFSFLEDLPGEILAGGDFAFMTPREAAASLGPAGDLSGREFSSWADGERDLTAWRGNALQRDALDVLYRLERAVKEKGDEETIEQWRRLQTSDHFYYMATKWSADGEVHKYFNPYPSPYDAYINYMNILDDFSRRLGKEKRA